MGTVVVATSETVERSADQLFHLFGSPASTSWLFQAQCDSTTPGAAVTLTLPLGPDQATDNVQLLGRVSRVVPSKLIVVIHDQPWHGVLRIRFDELAPDRARVRVSAELDQEGLCWLMRRRGWRVPQPANAGHRPGLLTSKTAR